MKKIKTRYKYVKTKHKNTEITGRFKYPISFATKNRYYLLNLGIVIESDNQLTVNYRHVPNNAHVLVKLLKILKEDSRLEYFTVIHRSSTYTSRHKIQTLFSNKKPQPRKKGKKD